MSSALSEDFVRLSKAIESFGCFFEKISSASTTPNKNLKKLYEFKKAFYANLSDPDQLVAALDQIHDRRPQASRNTSKTPTHASRTSLDEKSQKIDSNFFSVNQSSGSKVRSSSQTQLPAGRKSVEHTQSTNREEVTTKALGSEYVPISNFLARIKAASHSEIAKLFTLSSSYSFARTFSDHTQPIMIGLCFGFFENILTLKNKNSQTSLTDYLDLKLEVNRVLPEVRETELYDFLRQLLEDSNEFDKVQKFYEYMIKYPKLYDSALSTFKQLMTLKFFDNALEDNEQKENSFEWLNDIEEVEGEHIQGLTELFDSSIRVFILTKNRMFEKVISDYRQAPNSQSPRGQNEITIFFDKNTSSIYVLHPLERSEVQSEKVQAKPTYLKSATADPETLKSMRIRQEENRGESLNTLNTLDTVTSPIVSINELAEGLNRNENPRLSHGRKFANIDTISSLEGPRDISLTPINQNYGSATRPSVERMPPTGPSSCPKDIRQFNFKGSDAFEDRLTPKEKEPVPTRSNNYFNYKENTVSDDKIATGRLSEKGRNETYVYSRQHSNPFPEHQTQFMAQRSSKEGGKITQLDRSATQDYSSLTFNGKPKGSYTNLTPKVYSTNLPWRDSPLQEVSQVAPLKPAGIPSVLKTKFDKVNQNVNQRDQDFDNLVGRYLRKTNAADTPQPKASNLDSIKLAYKTIMSQNKSQDQTRSAMGTYLKMDR